uniref:LAGLIDADG homing endonuclease n=1 Tax=Pappia fissilis TaxID=1040649 RepID=UPI002A812925|nr:LAGLIDADG homing endonuclease [Pappia fissilis]WOX61277.1 LAGLIDADG homing endonuclease [Pappia fissilis]
MWPNIMLLIVYIIYACAISWKYIVQDSNILELKIYNKTILLSDLLNAIINRFLSPCLIFFLKKMITGPRVKFMGLVPNSLKELVGYAFILNINPNIVRYYYKIYNQQITKVIKNVIHFHIYKGKPFSFIILINDSVIPYDESRSAPSLISKFNYCYADAANNMNFNLLRVGISETICTQKKIIKNNNLQPQAISYLLLSSNAGKKNQFNIGSVLRGMSTLSTNLISSASFTLDKGVNLIQDPNAPHKIIKDNHNNEISLKFKQWFAGITDGDGYIYVTKDGYVGFEMTLPTCDEKVLRIIQNKFGGNIKARSGVKAVRYRSQNKETVTKIIHCLNGLVINNIRLAQLHKACLALNIPIKNPILPTIDSAYISGLLDSDGNINIYKHHYKDTFRYQLTISITNKSRCNIEFLLNVIGGNIYFDKSKNGCYIWRVNSKLLHIKLYDYFIKFPPKTIKAHRTYLINELHKLNELKAYRDTNVLSMNFKKWKRFITKWDNKISPRPCPLAA